MMFSRCNFTKRYVAILIGLSNVWRHTTYHYGDSVTSTSDKSKAVSELAAVAVAKSVAKGSVSFDTRLMSNQATAGNSAP